jgi:hypothetical protein
MSDLKINASPSITGSVYGVATSDLFGGILINQNDFSDYTEDYEQLGLTFVRYPGGTISEVGIVVDGAINFASEEITYNDMITDRSDLAYDLSFPELTNPALLDLDVQDGGVNSYGSLSEVMEFCVANDAALSIILPTVRYFNGVNLGNPDEANAMVNLIRSDVVAFLDRFLSGEFNDGKYPAQIIFEIGNEVYDSPVEYAVVAQVYLEAIKDQMAGQNIDYRVAFQMNVGSSQFQQLQDDGYFSQFFDSDGQALITQLEGFNFDPEGNYSFSERTILIEKMMAHILGNQVLDIDLLRHHYLTVDAAQLENDSSVLTQRDEILDFWKATILLAGGSTENVDYYISAWTTDSSNTGDGAGGLSAATNTLLLYQYFLERGVDMAAAWGINGSQKFWPDNSPKTVLTFSEQEGITPGGAILGLMSEDIIGLTHWESRRDNTLEYGDPTDYLEFIYSSGIKTVIFYSIGEIGDLSLEMSIDLWAFGYFSSVEIQNLGTETGFDSGLAKIEHSEQSISDNVVTVSFDQSYEVVKVTFELSGLVGTSGEDNITGTSEQDVIYGLDGSDLINAWAGDDRIFGDLGDDIIYGNSGDDLIFGGKSSDKLFGGDGEDFISGGSGSDNLYGGSENDIISGGRGSDSLYGGDGDDLIYADWSDLYGDSEQADLEESRSLEQEPGWSESIIELFWENYLSGGGGDDILIGGKGADVFVFESGRDVIRGFQIGLDVIAVNRPNMDNLSEDNSPFSSMTDAGLVLDFGNGDEILFEGLFSNNLGGDSIIFYG